MPPIFKIKFIEQVSSITEPITLIGFVVALILLLFQQIIKSVNNNSYSKNEKSKIISKIITGILKFSNRIISFSMFAMIIAGIPNIIHYMVIPIMASSDGSEEINYSPIIFFNNNPQKGVKVMISEISQTHITDEYGRFEANLLKSKIKDSVTLSFWFPLLPETLTEKYSINNLPNAIYLLPQFVSKKMKERQYFKVKIKDKDTRNSIQNVNVEVFNKDGNKIIDTTSKKDGTLTLKIPDKNGETIMFSHYYYWDTIINYNFNKNAISDNLIIYMNPRKKYIELELRDSATNMQITEEPYILLNGKPQNDNFNHNTGNWNITLEYNEFFNVEIHSDDYKYKRRTFRLDEGNGKKIIYLTRK